MVDRTKSLVLGGASCRRCCDVSHLASGDAALGYPGCSRAEQPSGGGTLAPRLLAVLEIALGTGAVASLRADADPWPWLMTIAAVDGT